MNDPSKDQPDSTATPAAAEQETTPATTGTASDPASEPNGAPAADPNQSDDGERSASAPPAAPKSASALAVIAVFVALLAIGGVGYVWNEQQAMRTWATRITALDADLDQRTAELNRVIDSVEGLTQADRQFDNDLQTLTAHFDAEFIALPARLARLERTLEKVPGISDRARTAWLRSEAEYFLRIANAQLNLAGNVGVSLRALELADEQLRDLADPALTPVREAISDERAALQAVPRPDAEGIVLTLGSLARSLDAFSLTHAVPERFAADGNGRTEESGITRAWRVIVDALTSIISVRRDDQKFLPLMTAAEESMLIRSLDIELQLARLAVIRNEGKLYRSALGAARERLRIYFDVSSSDVATALATLDELMLAELPEQLPDISGSLTLLLRTTGEDATR